MSTRNNYSAPSRPHRGTGNSLRQLVGGARNSLLTLGILVHSLPFRKLTTLANHRACYCDSVKFTSQKSGSDTSSRRLAGIKTQLYVLLLNCDVCTTNMV
jgi:hypothetical protein